MKVVLKRQYRMVRIPAVPPGLILRVNTGGGERTVSSSEVLLYRLDEEGNDMPLPPIIMTEKEFKRDFSELPDGGVEEAFRTVPLREEASA